MIFLYPSCSREFFCFPVFFLLGDTRTDIPSARSAAAFFNTSSILFSSTSLSIRKASLLLSPISVAIWPRMREMIRSNPHQMGIRDMIEERGNSEFIKQQHSSNRRLTFRNYTSDITNVCMTNVYMPDENSRKEINLSLAENNYNSREIFI